MDGPVTVIPVTPTGQQECPAFVDGPEIAELRFITTNTYPPSPRGEALRELRGLTELTMGDLARTLGLDVVTVSSLEHGRVTLSDADWCAVFVTLATEWRRRNPRQVIDLEELTAACEPEGTEE